MQVTTELYYIQSALYDIGYSVTEVNSLITLMYKCKTFCTNMDNEISTICNPTLYNMYLFQMDEINSLIPYLDANLYPYGPGPGEEDSLMYAKYDLLYESSILIYTIT
jgi:hypothetical protein